MIKIEHTEVYGWESAIRGMRNPMNSWDKSDSHWVSELEEERELTETGEHITMNLWVDRFEVGENDLKLMKNLSKAGNDHSKFLRMITVTVDLTAPTFWWAEFDTYKVATVRNSCSKMHKIHVKPFELKDFTHEGCAEVEYAYDELLSVIKTCERLREDFNRTQDKRYWRALIELLPEGYNLRATVQMPYAVLKNMYFGRHFHKLTEWHTFCEWIEELPYFREICIQ